MGAKSFLGREAFFYERALDLAKGILGKFAPRRERSISLSFVRKGALINGCVRYRANRCQLKVVNLFCL